MIFGKIEKNEKIIKFNIEMQCVNCCKKVPGGMKSGETYFKTAASPLPRGSDGQLFLTTPTQLHAKP